MHRRRLIARVLALALLVAQFGAEVHADSHLRGEPYGIPGSPQSCGLCLSFMPLATAVGGAPCIAAIDLDKADGPAAANTVLLSGRTPRPAFRPRAPPDFL